MIKGCQWVHAVLKMFADDKTCEKNRDNTPVAGEGGIVKISSYLPCIVIFPNSLTLSSASQSILKPPFCSLSQETLLVHDCLLIILFQLVWGLNCPWYFEEKRKKVGR